MQTDLGGSLERRARLHAALGDPLRLAVVDELLVTDASPSELGARLAVPSNLLAHHVNLLEKAGVVQRLRSEGDGRRIYLRLVVDLVDTLVMSATVRLAAPRVVFVCTQNSARSQLARALWRRRSRVAAASAGTRPAARVHPRAVEVARRHGLSLDKARPRRVTDVVRPSDLVVAVCDNAYEEFIAAAPRHWLHWSIPDPVRAGREAAFETAFSEIDARVARLVPVVTTNNRD